MVAQDWFTPHPPGSGSGPLGNMPGFDRQRSMARLLKSSVSRGSLSPACLVWREVFSARQLRAEAQVQQTNHASFSAQRSSQNCLKNRVDGALG